jgi:hypothetical protein
MAHQPMGVMPGIGVRHFEAVQKQEAAVAHELEVAIIEAGNLEEDLINHPALLVVAQQLEARVNKFLETDEQSLALMKIINTWKGILLAPQVAQMKVKKILGARLNSIFETQAAP